jgi:cytoskeleton protein RodZ
MTDISASSLPPFSELRERQGMSVGDVAQRTRMSTKQIEALDRGEYAVLPGTAFTKGAIRSYCKMLGVEPQPYLDAYVQGNPEAQAQGSIVQVSNLSTTMPQRGDGGPSDSRSGRMWVLLGAALMIVAIGFYFTNPSGSKLGGQASAPSSGASTANKPADTLPSQVTILPGNSATSAGSVPLVESPLSASANKPVAAAPESAPISAKTGLQFELGRDAWIEVRDAQGKVLASRLFKKGEDTKIDVGPPFSLVVGSASSVVALYNGKSLDLKTNTRDDVARVTITAQ